MIAYHPDHRISEAVAMLVASNEVNPYSGNPPTTATIAVIVETIAWAYGRKAAKSVTITVH
jgi:hypothetical protein